MSMDFFGIFIRQVGYHILLRDKYADNDILNQSYVNYCKIHKYPVSSDPLNYY